VVRKVAGIEFAGWDPTLSSLVAEVEMRDEPEWGIRRDDNGTHGLGPLDGGPRVRAVVSEAPPVRRGEATLEDLRLALGAVWGTDFGVHSPTWISRFTDTTRQAVSYRAGRVLLAGDAAHVHYPVGGQGLNLGVQDAVNLGWKLAQVVKGVSPPELLDTYQAERHPVAARVLRNTIAATVLTRGNARLDALRDLMTDLLAMDGPRRLVGGMIAALDVHYDLGEGHPLLGRRMPDLTLHTPDGPRRAFSLLHAARPVLLDLGAPGRFDLGPWSDRVDLVEGTATGPWELPVLGPVPAALAVLVRPDGHVAWVATDEGGGIPPRAGGDLNDALARWFGPPRAQPSDLPGATA
jgi:hypothetical protein